MSAQRRALETAICMARAALARRDMPRRPRDTAWHAEAEQRYRAGENLRQIAAAVGRSHGQVQKVLAARGVPRRKRGGGGTTEQRQAAGRKGGTVTRERYGRGHFARIAGEDSRRYWERYERSRARGKENGGEERS